MSPHAAYNTYAQNAIRIESPEKLIEMMYEGILRFAPQAIRAIEAGDIEKKIYYINRTSAIFSELISTLSYDKGGEVCYYLAGLYDHQLKLLVQGNADNDVEAIQTVIRVTKGLLEAWREMTGLGY